MKKLYAFALTLLVLSISDVFSQNEKNTDSFSTQIVTSTTPVSNEVGKTDGFLDVALNGSASYTIPLKVPQGVNSVEPKLALSFNSSSGNGLAGYGWNISGLSVITRTSLTKFHDGLNNPVDNKPDDRLMFDGQRLLLENGTSYFSSNSTFVTENYSNLKISMVDLGSGSSTLGRLSGFVVNYPDGSKAYYGYSEDSRSNFSSNNPSDFITNSWAITYWENAQGLRISYTYDNSNGYFKVKSIKYGVNVANPTNEIEFVYKDRARTEQSFVGTQNMALTKILVAIRVKSLGVTIRNYVLQHKKDYFDYELLTNFTEKNGDESKSLNPIRFNYYDTEPSCRTNKYNYELNFDATNYKIVTGDFIGDNKTDFLYYSGNAFFPSVQIKIRNKDLYTVSNIDKSLAWGFGLVGLYPVNILKSLSDGQNYLFEKQAFVTVGERVIRPGLFSNTNSNTKEYYFETNTLDPQNSNSCIVENIIVFKDPITGYKDSYGAFSSYRDFKDARNFLNGDFDGDGINDILIMPVCTKSNTTLSIPLSGDFYNAFLVNLRKDRNPNNITNVGVFENLDVNINEVAKIEVADFNGDGKSDILILDNRVIKLFTLNKENTRLVTLISQEYGFSTDCAKELKVGDFNGDGKLDFVMPIVLNQRYMNFFLFKGDTFMMYSKELSFGGKPKYENGSHNTYHGEYILIDPPILTQINYTADTNFIVHDFNNDGKSDIAEITNYFSRGKKYRNNPNEPFTEDYSNAGKCYRTDAVIAYNICDFNTSNINFKTYVKNTPEENYENGLGLGDLATLAIDNSGLPELHFLGKVITHFYAIKNYATSIAQLYAIDESNGVQKIINYNGFDNSSNPQDNTYQLHTSKSIYPDVNLNKFPNGKLVALISEVRDGVIAKKQLFKYCGAVCNTEGLGFFGFRRTLRTNWFAEDSKIVSTVSKYDMDKRGALQRNYSRLGLPTVSIDVEYFDKLDATTFNYNNGANPLLPNKVYKLNKTSEFFRSWRYGSQIVKDITYEYTSANNPSLIKVVTSNGSTIEQTATTTLGYDAITIPYMVDRLRSKKVTITTPGSTTSSEELYDYSGTLLKRVKKKGNGTNYVTEDNEFDSYGNITKKTLTADGLTPRVSKFEYDTTKRFLVKKIDVEGLETLYNYNDVTGLLLAETLPSNGSNLLKTTFEYDTWGKLIKKTNYLGKNEVYNYALLLDFSVLKTTTNDDGSSSKITYDNLGREIKKEVLTLDNNWSTVTTDYNIYNQVIKTTLPYYGNPTAWNEMQYDIFGSLTQATTLKSASSPGKVTNYSYSGLSVTENDGVKTKITTNNSLGKTVTVSETPGGQITYTYFASGNLKSTNFGGGTIVIEEDGWGRRKSLKDPSAGDRLYEYNDFGELIKEVVVGKGETTYNFTVTGKPQGATIKNESGTITGKKQYTYDPTTKLLSKLRFNDDANGTFTEYNYSYDGFKRLYKTDENTGQRAQFIKTLSFDSFGRPETETFFAKNNANNKSSTKTIKHTYVNGYNSKIMDSTPGSNPIWENLSFTPQGNLQHGYYGNGLASRNSFDEFGFPTSNSAMNGRFTVFNFDYVFDPIRGNLSSRSISLFGVSMWEDLTYDNLDRLTGFIDRNGIQTQTYNDNGTIDRNSLGKHAYSISGKPFQVSSVTLTLPDGSDNVDVVEYYNDRPQTISYNLYKSPIRISEGGVEIIDFEYNAFNSRTAMYYGGTQSDKVSRPYRKFYSADGTMEIKYNVTNGNTEFVTYIGGDAYDAPAIVKSDGIEQKYYYLHRDYQGTIVAITDQNQTLVERRLFDVWGGLIRYENIEGVTTIPTSTNSLFLDRGYTGHEHLLGVNLINMNGRIYDYNLHRFLQPDNNIQSPTNTQNYNRYGYCMNNPTKYTDQSGEFWGFVAGFLFSTYVHGAQATGDANPLNWNAGQWLNAGLGAASGALSSMATNAANDYIMKYGQPTQAQQNYMAQNPIQNPVEGHSYVDNGYNNNDIASSDNFLYGNREDKYSSLFEFTSDYTQAPLIIEQIVGSGFETGWIKSSADSNILTISAAGGIGYLLAPLGLGTKASMFVGGATSITNSYTVQNKISYRSINKTLWYGKVTHNIFTGEITNVIQSRVVHTTQNIITKIEQRVIHDFSGNVIANTVNNVNRYIQIINNPAPRVGMNIKEWK